MTVLTDVNIRIELMRTGFLDCIAHRYDGKEWMRIYIEFDLNALFCIIIIVY